MSTICWAGSQRRSVDTEGSRGVICPFLVITGLWAINILVVSVGLPILGYAKLKRFLVKGKPATGVRLSKPAHP
jgi:hypothetical protein